MAEKSLHFESCPDTNALVIGLKLRISAEELQKHFVARSEYHETRAQEKDKELPDLRATLERIKSTKPAMSIGAMNKSNSNYNLDPDEPIKELEQDIRDHRNKSLAFKFFAEHLFGMDYMLDETDLVRLEILKR